MRRRKVVPHELGSVSENSVVDSLPKLDLFPKIEREYNVQTTEGGALSIVTYVIMLILFFSEFLQYSRLRVTEHLQVDKEAEGRLRINLNITFPKLTCADVNLVAMDVAGEHQLGISHTVHKHRLDKDGNTIGEKFASKLATKHDVDGHDTVKPLPKDYCGSCYGAAKKLENGKDSCCNDCDSVKSAYATKGWDVSGVVTTAEQCTREAKNPAMSSRHGEGCNVEGHLQVNKVAGNIHIALGKSRSVNGRLIHQFSPNQLNHFDTSHTVNTLSFGEPFPGQTNPLDTVSKSINIHKSKTGVYQYYIKVIPTLYTKSNGVGLSSNQYSYTDKFVPVGEGVPEEDASKKEHQPHHGHGHRHASIIRALPGVFFIYDMSPFQVRRTEEATSISHFLVRLCAVLGGVFAVSRMIDRFCGGAKELVVGKRRKRSSGSGMMFG